MSSPLRKLITPAQYKRKTGFKGTDDQISRIMKRMFEFWRQRAAILINSLVTVQTGAITAISAAADVIIFLLLPVCV